MIVKSANSNCPSKITIALPLFKIEISVSDVGNGPLLNFELNKSR
jgi:hypothetical protein